MGNGDKRMKRSRTKALRVSLSDWMVVDEVAGEDRPMKEGFHEIIEKYREFENMERADLSDVLGG